jgi:hypothetical protein
VRCDPDESGINEPRPTLVLLLLSYCRQCSSHVLTVFDVAFSITTVHGLSARIVTLSRPPVGLPVLIPKGLIMRFKKRAAWLSGRVYYR